MFLRTFVCITYDEIYSRQPPVMHGTETSFSLYDTPRRAAGCVRRALLTLVVMRYLMMSMVSGLTCSSWITSPTCALQRLGIRLHKNLAVANDITRPGKRGNAHKNATGFKASDPAGSLGAAPSMPLQPCPFNILLPMRGFFGSRS